MLFKTTFKIIYCNIFHKKIIKEAKINKGLYIVSMGKFKGCEICDIWQQIEENNEKSS